jgi:hypothetical protein
MQGSRHQADLPLKISSFYFEQRVRDVLPMSTHCSSRKLVSQLAFTGWTGTTIACTLNTIPATVSLERR